MRQPVWVEGAARLCAEHFESTTGMKPPAMARAIKTGLERLPPSEGAWQKIVPGLRARVRPAGLELQGVRNVQLETVEIGDGCAWLLSTSSLVELMLVASDYRDSPESLKAQVRVQIIRLLEGKERP